MKRILSIDGGGIRGVFALQVLAEVERILQGRHGKDYRLCDHFDLIAGTSTGAIIAACLGWGMSVEEVDRLYTNHGKSMFARRWLPGPTLSFYSDHKIRKMLRSVFHDVDAKGKKCDALLGSQKLKTLVMFVTLRCDTLSPWPLTNNPNAKFNNPNKPWNNLNIPLWQIVRASTAAPPYFPAQQIKLLESVTPKKVYRRYRFIDGGVSSFNNPSALAVRKALLPPYRLNWEVGEKNLYLLSVGCSDPIANKRRKRKGRFGLHMFNVGNLYTAIHALTSSSIEDQDTVCRILGKTIYGHPLDIEIGDLINPPTTNPKFSYVRYQKIYTPEELEAANKQKESLGLNAVTSIEYIRDLGRVYASDTVEASHIL